MEMSENINELATALSKAQATFTGARKVSANPFFKSSYADLKEVMEATKHGLAENGLSLAQFPLSFEGRCGVTSILMHSSGQWLKSDLLLATTKQDPQAYGSAITYAKRYAWQAILGIPSEDDDGNSATFTSKQNEAKKRQQQTIASDPNGGKLGAERALKLRRYATGLGVNEDQVLFICGKIMGEKIDSLSKFSGSPDYTNKLTASIKAFAEELNGGTNE